MRYRFATLWQRMKGSNASRRRSLASAVVAGAIANALVVGMEQLLVLPWHHRALLAHGLSWPGSMTISLMNGSLSAVPAAAAVVFLVDRGRCGRGWRGVLAAMALIAAIFLGLVALPGTERPSVPKLIVHLTSGLLVATFAVGIGVLSRAHRKRLLAYLFVGSAIVTVLAFNLLVFPHLYVRHHMFLAVLPVTWLALGLQRYLRTSSLSWRALGLCAVLALAIPSAGLLVRDPYARFLTYRYSEYGKVTGNFADILRARLSPPRRPSSFQGLPAEAGPQGTRRRWVVVLLIDTLRADRIFADKAAAQGLARRVVSGRSFTRAYSQWTCTEHSLLSVLRGDYERRVDERLMKLRDQLVSAGVANFVAVPDPAVAEFYEQAGFEVVEVKDHKGDEEVLAAAMRFAEQHSSEGGVLWLHLMGPHDATGHLSPTPKEYDERVARLDHLLEPFLDRIGATLGPQDVAWMLLADHGESFGAHGVAFHCQSLYEDVLHVPVALWGAGIEAGRSTEPIELVDIAPTLVYLATGNACPWCAGRSLLGSPLRGRCALSRGNLLRGELVSLSCSRWKLISDLSFGFDELYDLERDPIEDRNLVLVEPSSLAAMRHELGDRTGLRGQ